MVLDVSTGSKFELMNLDYEIRITIKLHMMWFSFRTHVITNESDMQPLAVTFSVPAQHSLLLISE